MKNPELFDLPLPPGILREPLAHNDQLILWVPEKVGPKFQFWTRISTIPGAVVHRQSGITTTPATAIRTRQYLPGFWSKLLGRFHHMGSDSGWILPTGARAEQCGERQKDLLLVWAKEGNSLDEKKIQERKKGVGVVSTGPAAVGWNVPPLSRRRQCHMGGQAFFPPQGPLLLSKHL
jgi:hypothetical protein